MGGTIKRGSRALLGFLLLCASIFPVLPVHAAGNLDQARDIASSVAPQENQVIHSLYFVLPPDANQLFPSDYILIDMPNYTNITLPNDVIGAYGFATFSLVGTQIRITGLTVLPGSSVSIEGITTTNPLANQSNQVEIRIATDASGTVVRNSAFIFPSTSDNNLVFTATVESELSGVHITGFAAPSAFVTLTENGSVLGTTTAAGDGFFSFSLSALNPGNHTFTLNGTDTLNRSTAKTVINLFALANTLTTASGIILSSTMQVSKSNILPGDALTISGMAKPLSQINLFVEAPLRSYTASTDGSGVWSYTLSSTDTKGFSPGQYQTYTVVQDSQGNQSVVSNSLNFQVGTPPSDNPPPACDISHGDLNCDHKVNLTDFSILLYHWRTNHRVADINKDGIVNLTDFSIMMFYYGK